MVRAPCCEKMGLKRGPWSPEEDHILVTYINLHGHSNWRALPKQAGLLRCGKSCRLRWTNYLKPDIKRGNFSLEEEQTIIELHQQLGNRWSAIAAKLPGRTDNEIKNVWHTHLKKRLEKQHLQPPKAASETTWANFDDEDQSRHLSTPRSEASESPTHPSSVSLQTSSSSEDDIMSSMTTVNNNNNNNYNSFCITNDELPEEFPGMDEEFWSEVLSADTSDTAAEPSAATAAGHSHAFACFDEMSTMEEVSSVDGQNMSMSMSMWEGVEFWHDLFTKAGEFPELIF